MFAMGAFSSRDNDGRLASGEGWLVSRAYSDGLERYWLYKMSNGYVAARVGFFTASDGKAYYAYPVLGHGSSGKDLVWLRRTLVG